MVANIIVFKNKRRKRYESLEDVKREFISSFRRYLLDGGLQDKYNFFVTESRGNSLYCYVVDTEDDTGAMFRVSDHKATVFVEDVDFGTIYYKEHEDMDDVAFTLYKTLVGTVGLMQEQVKLSIQEYKVLEFLLYLNLSGYRLKVDVEKRAASMYLVGMQLEQAYKGLTQHVGNFFTYTGIEKITVGDLSRCREDLDLACKNKFYELMELEVLRSLISKGVLTLFQESSSTGVKKMSLGDVYRLNLNAKGLYYISSIGLGVTVLRGITLSSWFTKYSLDLLLNSTSWQARDKVGAVKWY